MDKSFGMQFLEEMKPVDVEAVFGSTTVKQVGSAVCTSYTTSPEGGGSQSDGCSFDPM
jgi:hypothetical protein